MSAAPYDCPCAYYSTSGMWMHFPPWSVYVNSTDLQIMQSNKTVREHTLDNATWSRINTVDHLKMVQIHINWMCSVAACFMLVSYLAYFSTLKMEATCSSVTSVDFQEATRRCALEDIIFYCYVVCKISCRYHKSFMK
jgi:hypothetical protein